MVHYELCDNSAVQDLRAAAIRCINLGLYSVAYLIGHSLDKRCDRWRSSPVTELIERSVHYPSTDLATIIMLTGCQNLGISLMTPLKLGAWMRRTS